MREEGKGISYISLHVHVRTCPVSSVVERSVYSVECRGFEVTALGMLCCFALLFV